MDDNEGSVAIGDPQFHREYILRLAELAQLVASKDIHEGASAACLRVAEFLRLLDRLFSLLGDSRRYEDHPLSVFPEDLIVASLGSLGTVLKDLKDDSELLTEKSWPLFERSINQAIQSIAEVILGFVEERELSDDPRLMAMVLGVTEAATASRVASIEHLRLQARDAAESIEQTATSAAKTTGNVGEDALGFVWTRQSIDEADSANRWRMATIVNASLAIVIAAAGITLAYFAEDTRWDLLSAKLVLVAAFGSLAAYCARQSAEHREAERYCRQLGNDLSILPAFLADLPADLQHEVKRQIALSRLGGPIARGKSSAGAEPGPGLVVNGQDLVRALLEAKTPPR